MGVGIVKIDIDRCKSCGICINSCPFHLLRFSEFLNSKGYHPVEQIAAEKCIGCGLCGFMCPDSVIQVYKED